MAVERCGGVGLGDEKASNCRGGEISHIGSVAELAQLVSNLFSAIWSGVGVCSMGTLTALTN